MILIKIGKKIARLGQFIENHKRLRLWRMGISIDEYLILNQPWLLEAQINTVFDIGANIGEFAILIHRLLPKASIYSFEPLVDCYEKLKNKMQNVNRFKAFNFALGDTDGRINFHRNRHLPSSSVLPMTDLHKQNYPHATEDATLEVRSVKLDDVVKDLKVKNNLLIKIDVQGFEDKVIAGGINTIKLSKILIIETSFQPLYTGQPIFEDIYNFLKNDFRYMGALGDIRMSKIDGSPLFEDSIFVSKSSHAFG